MRPVRTREADGRPGDGAAPRRRWLARAALAWLALCALGELTTSRPAPRLLPGEAAETQLVCAPLPSVLALVARHCWFVIRDEPGTGWERWEVWQDAGLGGHAWGHVYRDLNPPAAGIGGGPPVELARLRGARAAAFAACLRRTSPTYAARDRYRAWPGPNSNSYVDAMLRTCGWGVQLPATAIGKDWRGLAGASRTPRGTGVQLDTPLVGLGAGLHEGVELHVLALTWGVDPWPPAIYLPFGDGRLGFADD